MTLLINKNSQVYECDKHNHVVVDKNIDAKIYVESVLSSQLHIELLSNATLSLYILSAKGLDYTSNISIQLADCAQAIIFDIGLLKDQGKKSFSIELLKPKSSVTYFGLDHLTGLADKKTDIFIHHKAEHTYSNQSCRGIYAENAKASVLSKVIIHKNCAKSQASQLYKSILVNPQAKNIIKPELEIYNHDIKASHGASIGQLDENAIFYLCSRGLTQKQAKNMLLSGFLSNITDQIKEEEIKTRYGRLIENTLKQTIDGDFL
jgi:Fe-S cluster assembly protein SufD